MADHLGEATPVKRGSFRDRMRSRPGRRLAWRIGVLLAGLVCIGVGFALAVFPGPLTIPPVVLGLWIWSTEFEWAHRLFTKSREKAVDAWEHSKRHPVSSAAITIGGLAAGVVAVWAVVHFSLVDRAKDLVGL